MTKMYIFNPKNDITIYEVADLLSTLQLSISEEVKEKLSPLTKRHFETEDLMVGEM